MPSAANKLEKQTSVGSVHTGSGAGGVGGVAGAEAGGGGGGGPGGAPLDSVQLGGGQNVNSISTGSESNTNSNENSAISNANNNNNNNIVISAKVATTAGVEASNPMKQALITIEHKIRNLEKRKTKLESYRAIQSTGKELSADQKAAVAKYDAVMSTLDFARDLSKQMLQFSKDAEKEQKKQARKEGILRTQAETAKIREVLVIQNILNCFMDENVRSDFLNGDNGAIKLETNDMAALEKFYMDSRTRRPESVDDAAFVTTAQKAAEIFSMTIDGRPKQYLETVTYEHLRRVFNQVQECGYLDKIYFTSPEASSEAKEDEPAAEGDDSATMGDNSLEDGMEKLNVSEGAETQEQGMLVGEGNGVVPPPQSQPQQQQQQQLLDIQMQPSQQLKEQLDLQQQINPPIAPQQQQQQLQQQQQQGIPAPPTGAGAGAGAGPGNVPNFQPPPSGTTTPVHVTMFSTQPPPPPQMQGVPPGSIISVQQGPPPPQMVVAQPPPPQPRQLLTGSAVATTGQIPQGTPLPLHGAPPPPNHFAATTVRAVEQGLFKQHQHQQQQQQQYLQQMRPLAEVIGGGSFYFLQESELDSPEIGTVGANAIPVNSIIFEQQHQQPAGALLNHGELPSATTPELHKTPLQQQQQQHLISSNIPQAQQLPQPQQQQQQQQQSQQPQQSQPQQPIPTQTFTNQSFPPIQQVQSTTAAGNNSNTANLSNSTPTTMFQQKHQQLFPPVGGVLQPTGQQQPPAQQQQEGQAQQQQQQQQQQQIILNDQQQQQQQPMMMIARLAATKAHLSQQQQIPPVVALQSGQELGATSNVGGFSFENPVVASLAYEQQIQQELVVNPTVLKEPNVTGGVGAAEGAVDKKSSDETARKFGGVEAVNDWEATLKSGGARSNGNVSLGQTNVAATAALTNVLKPNNSSSSNSSNNNNNVSASSGGSGIETGKWSTEISSMTTSNTQGVRKNDWSSNAGSGGGNGNAAGGNGGGYGDGAAQPTANSHETNHWNSNQQQDGGVHFNGRFQRRRGGRPGNYGSSSQNGVSGRGGGGGGGIYFRNNENSSSSYYQNGGGGGGGGGGGNVYQGGKDSGSRYDSGGGGGGNYRGPRGGNSNGRGNGPTSSRSIGRTGGGGGGGNSGGPGNSSSSTSSSYMRNRMSLGMEK